MRALPWWTSVLLVVLATRVTTTAILLVDAALQPANAFSPESPPPYWRFASYWDGIWYQRIAAEGYPSTLPVDQAGDVTENAWAFLPAYPGLVRGLSALTSIPYEPIAIAVSVLCTLGTALILHRILVRRMPSGNALWGVTLFCFAPLSPILQVGYAEPMQLLLIAAAILLVIDRRYALAIPVVLLGGLTRPTGLALALFLLLHLAQRIRSRGREPFPPHQAVALCAAGGTAFLAGIAWPVVAGIVTGVPDAYTRTELVWRVGYIGQGHLVPFAPWFQGAAWWLRFAAQVPEPAASVIGAVIVAALGALLALVLLLPSVARRLGPEPRLWVASYAVYLLAVFFPQSSTFRLLMPAFPLLGAVQPRSAAIKALILAGCVALQCGWVAICWWVAGYDWSPP